MASELRDLVEVLKTGGPYALVIFLGFAYWMKDKYICRLHARLMDMSVQNAQAMEAMRGAIDSLKDTLNAISSRL